MTSVSLPNTSRTAANPNDFADVYGNDVAITNVVNGNLDTSNLKAAAAITDAQLAAPVSATWRTVHTAAATLAAGTTTAAYLIVSGGLIASAAGTAGLGTATFYFDPAAYAISGRSTFVRVRTTLLTNTTAPGVNVTLGFAPITASAGAAGQSAITTGASVAAVTYTAPTSSGLFSGASTSAAAPSVGIFAPYVLPSGTTAANSFTTVSVAVDVANA